MNGCANSEPETTRSTFAEPAARRRGNLLQSRQREVQTLYRRWLRGLLVFLLVSTCFFRIRGIDLLAPLAENTRQLLGCPPPPALTSLALSGYLFSAVILILDRFARGARPSLKWQHLVYRTIFFFFYAVAGALNDYFIVVFAAGLTLFGVELLNIRAHAVKGLPSGSEMAGGL